MTQQNAFYKMDAGQSAAVLRDANPAFKDAAFAPDAATLLAHDLDFYPGYRLIDITDYKTIPPIRRMLLHRPGEAVVINWTNAPVYGLNRAALMLTPNNVLDYVRFFYKVVHGRHGRFTLIENIGDIPWHEDPPPAARKAVSRMIQPMQVMNRDDAGDYSIFACLVYQTALFRATVRVESNGNVTLHDQEMLVEDLPVRDEVLGQ